MTALAVWSVALLAVTLGHDVRAAEAARRSFDLSADTAEQSLKKFSQQSGREVLFATDSTRNVRTNSVKGDYTPQEAVDLLLAGTGLVAQHNARTGAYTIARDADPNAQRAARPTAGDRPMTDSRRTIPDAEREARDEVLQLSPFEVVSQNTGYYGANAMSGTRLNSRIEDLAASITVITKEQMADFGLLDLHDIFAYEAGTEGLGSYTEISADTDGGTTDEASLNPLGSNRIRGIGAANVSMGNFETSGRVPVDPIDIDGVEISRGPNSSIFGIGNIAGTVNMVPSSANISRHAAQVTARADSYEGFRTSLDVNRVLLKDKLAARGSVVYQRDGYHLKPSGIDTVRLNGMVKYRPFRTTTLSASFSDYRMHGTRRNYLTPSDGVTDWIENGRPSFNAYDAVTIVNGAVQPTNAAILSGAQGNILAFVDAGRLDYLAFNRYASLTNPVTSAGGGYRQSNFRVRYPNQPLFRTKLPITDRAIYDWNEVNLASANYHHDEAQTTRVMLEQVFLSSPRQQLAAQTGWFREQTESFSRIAVGIPRQDGDSNPIFIDVNTTLLDGRPNPYYGRPYIATVPYFQKSPAERDTYRLQLAYRLDLRNEKHWARWLGAHSLSAYGEYKNLVQRRARWRNTIISDNAWYPVGASRGGNQGNGVGGAPTISNVLVPALHRIYIGDDVGGNVDYGPTFYANGSNFIEWGASKGGQWLRDPVEWGPVVVNGTGLAGNTLTKLKSRGVVIQSHLLGDRIIPTFGWRHDESYTRIGGEFVSRDGITFDYDTFNSWEPGDWTKGAGPTRTAGIVLKPLRWLSLYANESDSFRPSAPKQDLYNRRLPDPNGIGKDYGVALALFHDTLRLRFNRYITRQLQTPNGPSATYVNRIRRIDFNEFNASSPPQLNDTFNLQRQAGAWATAEAQAQGRTLTQDELNARVADIMKVPVEFLAPPPWDNGAADDTLARGFEIEVNYNPTNTWTMKFNLTQQETINERIAPEVKQWVEERLPVWQSIIDPTTGQPWYTTFYEGSAMSAQRFVEQNVLSQIDELRATEGLSRPQVRKYRANFLTNFRLSGITDHRILRRFNVGGAIRWEDKGAIGYYGQQQPPTIVTAYDLSRPIYDKAHTYFDLLVGYRTRLFSDRIGARFQLNVRNVQEDGRLQPIGAFPDGTPYAYRIVEPRLFILSASFDL